MTTFVMLKSAKRLDGIDYTGRIGALRTKQNTSFRDYVTVGLPAQGRERRSKEIMARKGEVNRVRLSRAEKTALLKHSWALQRHIETPAARKVVRKSSKTSKMIDGFPACSSAYLRSVET